jgi:hypothetical protein
MLDVRLSFVLLLSSLFAGQAQAAIVKYSLPELVQASDLIVRGEVVRTECRWAHYPIGRVIVTDVTLSPSGRFLGTPDSGDITVETQGGVVGDRGLWVEDAARFRTGEEVIVFLSRADDRGRRSVTNFCNGKYTISGQRVEETGMPEGELVARIVAAVKAVEERSR